MPEFVDPPASQTLLTKISSDILGRSFSNLNVTIIGFPGSGIISEIKYLIRNIQKLNSYKKDRVIVFIDIELLLEDEASSFKDMLRFMLDFFSFIMHSETVELIKAALSARRLSAADISMLLHHLTAGKDLGITLVLDNFGAVFDKPKDGKLVCKTLTQIRKVNPMRISFVFNCTRELDGHDADILGELCGAFIEHFVYGKDLLLDQESTQRLFINQGTLYKHTFSKRFIAKASELSFGDPAVLKEFANKARAENSFESEFLRTMDPPGFAALLGPEFVDYRYRRIFKSLGQESLAYLIGVSEKPSDYLIKTGLAVKKGSPDNGKLINPLFAYYVKTHQPLLEDMAREKGTVVDTTQLNLKENLSGQEYVLHAFLQKHPGQLVTREAAALAVWGDSWEQTYSDQALDKLVSTLRAKLKRAGISETVKSLKGRGLLYA